MDILEPYKTLACRYRAIYIEKKREIPINGDFRFPHCWITSLSLTGFSSFSVCYSAVPTFLLDIEGIYIKTLFAGKSLSPLPMRLNRQQE